MGHAPRIAIIGAGMGGLVAYSALRQRGIDSHIFEQAPHFLRLGAGIQMSPNAMRVLRSLGLEERVKATAFRPGSWKNRTWDTGAMQFELPLGDAASARYGADYLLMHRGDLHEALVSIVPDEAISLDRRVVGIETRSDGVEITFQDGTRTSADIVVGADGVHSRVRETLLGPEKPDYTGRVAYRATFPVERLSMEIDECTKWWGEDRHIVIYLTTAARDEVYFVTSLPEPDWTLESWSAKGDVDVLRSAFASFHPQVRDVLRACPEVNKWAIVDRKPLPHWQDGRMVILGDAAHPMTPYMAQGAAMAMEDGVMLARCIAETPDDVAGALARFEATRQARAARVQAGSHANTWMRERTDPDWCYGYDVLNAPIASGDRALNAAAG
ncbi:FAD-dependent monooxygenase [Propylenella binzhouense]|uniref:Salicylate 1-monooxygenase n=1 Tax=Propylenella binzhouense TaxID=2555902 RepID=A0A964T175_9HYPH|nr:FAD-dependent monooxygenase [Propylenella binzhouense]MYZ46359.1 salicylate 1-monooxygenase [Propylenella binzhouense]